MPIPVRSTCSLLTIFVVISAILWAFSTGYTNRGGPLVPTADSPAPACQHHAQSVIVQGRDVETATRLVGSIGGTVIRELGIINAVGAEISADQIEILEGLDGIVRIYHNRELTVSCDWGEDKPETEFPKMIDADLLHSQGITGAGVTVAVVDTGLWDFQWPLCLNSHWYYRVLAKFDAQCDKYTWYLQDKSGHGTHVTSVIASSAVTKAGLFQGVAPDVNLVSVKAFDETGKGTYLDVIAGLDWIVDHKEDYSIDVLNLSFSVPPVSFYWDDPLNQAVMRAWDEGIVVVASAGNAGPDSMTVGVPGNIPYIITAGAASDNYTPETGTDNFLTSFSSAGPTVEGFVKPEVVAPGGHILGMMPPDCWIVDNYGCFLSQEGDDFYRMSGSSQSAAVVSGLVALLLQSDPTLTPDEVKGKLMASAVPAVDEYGDLAYSVFQQGSGLVNAWGAVFDTGLEEANQTLDIRLELQDLAHYGGFANRDQDGNYYLTNVGGYVWNDQYAWGVGYAWSDAYVWSDGYMWSDARVFIDGYMWSDHYGFDSGYDWSGALEESMSINSYVPQE